jgi:mannose-6-phosphate isomerase-like protein (cupin superfamily)
MPRKQLRFGHGFNVVVSNRSAQGASMVLGPGESEGGPDNQHRGSDQWLYVVSGIGSVIVGGRREKLRAGTLLLIPRKTTHEIRNTGRTPLKTLNLYVPPAYTSVRNPLPRGRA